MIQVEISSSKQHFTNEFRQHEENLAHKDYRQQFLNSLRYPEIYSRQERVAEAHKATFQWVYEPDGFQNSAPRWYNIVHWLEKDSGIYWINGKAGSGKSTLMNFIHQNDRTSALLGAWAGGKKVLTPGFFFWNAGTTLEKSFQGLLRSLLYQILQKVPDLTPVSIDPISFESQPALVSESNGVQESGPFAAWTERRLRTTFESVLRQAKGNCNICVFIDGLDEISGDSETVIAAIKSMQSAEVKVCLSSRPNRLYTDTFSACAKLRLQDLTEPDIRTYVSDKLQPFMRAESALEVSDLMNTIVLKAQGVFIWVELVVKTLIKGLRNEDTLEQLQSRVESLPSDVEALYARMLSKIDVEHRRDAARLFQMALANLTRSVLDTALALHILAHPVFEISLGDALRYSLWTQSRIPDICAGLLEVHLEDKDSEEGGGKIMPNNGYLSLPIRYTRSPEAAQVSFQERYAHVDFIHRTAVDFLRQGKQGQHFLESNSQSCPSPYTSYVRGLLAKVTLLGLPEKPAEIDPEFEKYAGNDTNGSRVENPRENFVNIVARNFVDKTMYNASGELENGPAQLLVCDEIDRTLQTVYQRHKDMSPLPHWSTQWGKRLWIVKEYPGDFLRVQRGSRSSSPDSFQSARSESEKFLLDRPFDFLGQAACYGLSYYVSKRFDMGPKYLDKEYSTYLLCCTLWVLCQEFCSRNLVPSQLNLVAELLRRGANPNTYVGDFSTTIWGKFLYDIWWGEHFAGPAFVTAMKTFLEYGADIHLKKSHVIDVHQVSLEGVWISKMRLYHEISPLYLIRGWLEHRLEYRPELKELEEIILSKSGHSSHRYSHVAREKDGYRWYKISKRQHDELMAALNAGCYEYAAPAHVSDCNEWHRKLRKIYIETLGKDEDFDSRISSEEDFPSSTDAEEEFHDTVTTQITAEVQDYRLIHE